MQGGATSKKLDPRMKKQEPPKSTKNNILRYYTKGEDMDKYKDLKPSMKERFSEFYALTNFLHIKVIPVNRIKCIDYRCI